MNKQDNSLLKFDKSWLHKIIVLEVHSSETLPFESSLLVVLNALVASSLRLQKLMIMTKKDKGPRSIIPKMQFFLYGQILLKP